MSIQAGNVDHATSAADLSADTNLGRALATGAAGTVNLAGAAGGDYVGILVDGGRRSGDEVAMQMDGLARCRAGGNIDEGDMLTSDANGQLVVASGANDIIIGVALQDAVSGDRFDVRLTYFESGSGAP